MARTNFNEIIAAVDIGTSKIVALIAEINDDSDLKIIGAGTHKSSGLKKGVVSHRCLKSYANSLGGKNSSCLAKRLHY